MRINARLFISSILILFFYFGSSLVAAAPNFPNLTSRVVDNAQLLTPQAKHDLETRLAKYEQTTTNQVVVLTLPTLNGYDIEDYGYQLGRRWQIGQKGKNNGVILIVAPKERKVRIEVGYGLEPVITDLISNQIIQTVILPSFKKGEYQKGIIEGTQSILDVLGGKTITKTKDKTQTSSKYGWLEWLFFLLIIIFFYSQPWSRFFNICWFWKSIRRKGRRWRVSRRGRQFWRRRIIRIMVKIFSNLESEQITKAIGLAEQRTCAEIAAVVVPRSDHYIAEMMLYGFVFGSLINFVLWDTTGLNKFPLFF